MVRVKLQTAGLQRGERRGRSDCRYIILMEDKASSGHHSSAFVDVSADAYREDAVLRATVCCQRYERKPLCSGRKLHQSADYDFPVEIARRVNDKIRGTGKFPAGLDLHNQIRCLLRHLPRKKLNIGTNKTNRSA